MTTNEMKPLTTKSRRLSSVWLIPLLALTIGISMVVHSYLNEGPTITVQFQSAEGLEEGVTKIKLLSVDIGRVEKVTLADDLASVRVTIKLKQEARPLLREDSRFWVVRARIGAGSISGLGTIVGGSYIELSPGKSSADASHFIGLEEPPLTPLDAPGLRLTLLSDNPGSINAGDPVLYQGHPVGRVETMTFDTQQRQARYAIFIDAPYDQLIDSSTRFWDTSGITINASADGVELQTGTLETLLFGGVAFGSLPELPQGSPVISGKEFLIYDDYSGILENPYRHGAYYVTSFQQSLRGLTAGAPVEYRGIKIGRVERILLREWMEQAMTDTNRAIPVLIYLEPGRLSLPDTPASVASFRKIIEKSIAQGLRATLETGNLLTGKQLVSINFYPDQEPVQPGKFKNYPLIPTTETGVARLEQQVTTLLNTLNTLPLQKTVEGLNTVLASADDSLVKLSKTLQSANKVMASKKTGALPEELTKTLEELRKALSGLSPNSRMYQGLDASMNSLNATLRNADALIQQFSAKPNSLIFAPATRPDAIPEAHQ